MTEPTSPLTGEEWGKVDEIVQILGLPWPLNTSPITGAVCADDGRLLARAIRELQAATVAPAPENAEIIVWPKDGLPRYLKPKLSSKEVWRKVHEKIRAEIIRRRYTPSYKKQVL